MFYMLVKAVLDPVEYLDARVIIHFMQQLL